MNKEFIGAFGIIFFVLLFGTFFYSYYEGWSYSDAFYFTGVTVLTIGYGDLTPTQPFTKIMTVIFGITTIGAFLYSVSVFSRKRYLFIEKLEHLPKGIVHDLPIGIMQRFRKQKKPKPLGKVK